jgi:hypothetical protein
MPIWMDIRREIEQERAQGDQQAQDSVRRRKLAEFERATQRPLVVYATDFTDPQKVRESGNEVGISPADKDGWVEVTQNLPDGPLDVMLHSPGGSPFTTEWVVSMLRSRFGPIRIIVPHSAKSAAAMIALSGEELLMDERGELGPIDPQMIVPRDEQMVTSPAQAIRDQFEKAQKDVENNPQRLAAWIPILRQYGPSLLEECANAITLSKQLVRKWLRTYMFAGEPDAVQHARRVADWIGNHNNFKAHGRQIGIMDLQKRGVKVIDLRTDTALRDGVWTVWTAYRVTFEITGAFKIFENSRGEAYIRKLETRIVQIPTQLPPPQPPASRPATTRAERRRQRPAS